MPTKKTTAITRKLSRQFHKAPNLNCLWADMIVEECVRQGIDHFFLAPGSRCAPLLIAAAKHPKVTSVVHFDERGLAFHALGYVAGSGKPAALVCTSGTAAANFLPAVIEASKKKLPLIIFTADRPPELQKTGAMQTIDQPGLYSSFVRWSYDMPCPTIEIAPEVVLTTIDQAFARAKGDLPGPVHINCMYREPLSPKKKTWPTKNYLHSIASWLDSQKPFTTYIRPQYILSSESISEVFSWIRRIKKGLIVVGKVGGMNDAQDILDLAERTGFPIFPDITSGLRLGSRHEFVIPYFDQILLSDKVREALDFDGIIHFGGRMTSKRFYDFIKTLPINEYLSVIGHPLRSDPYHQVTLRVVSSPQVFCSQVIPQLDAAINSSHVKILRRANDAVAKELSKRIAHNTLSEPGIVRSVSQLISADSSLFLGNSMPVRDMDMFADPNGQNIPVSGNRGASGIDGLIASAAGLALGTKKQVTAILGDVSCLHDINSLALLKGLTTKAILIVINNDGGGIFSFLPIVKETPIFEKCFATPHGFSFEHAAQMFDLNYASSKDLRSFQKEYTKALTGPKSIILEIKTDRQDSAGLHDKLRIHVEKVLGKGL